MTWEVLTSKQTTVRDKVYFTKRTLMSQANLMGQDISFRGEGNNFSIQFTDVGKDVKIVRICKIRASSNFIASTELIKAVYDKCFSFCKAKRALNSTEEGVIE